MKRLRELSADRISHLPANVIEQILVLLPLKDAARTSVLSSKWKHHWRRIPQLVFDKDFAGSVHGESNIDVNNRLMFNIYKILLFHDGPVTTFELSCPRLMPCDEIDQFILYLSTRGIQEFTLRLSRSDSSTYELPSSLFSAVDLRFLTLKYCILTGPPSRFVGFNKLTYLELKGVDVPSNFFESFVPKCPMLESLTVNHCAVPDGLEIVAPVLTTFVCMGCVHAISFKSTPLLSLVHLDVSEVNRPDVIALLASLPAIEDFTVNFENLKNIAASNHDITFQTLKNLYVTDIILDSFENARSLVCLITSFPNLESLQIQLNNGRQSQDEDAIDIRSFLETGENCHGSNCFQQLREFTFEGSLGTKVELDFVRFALATSPLLRMMYILPSDLLCSKREKRFMKQVMQLKRVSKEAEVKYGWDDDDDNDATDT